MPIDPSGSRIYHVESRRFMSRKDFAARFPEEAAMAVWASHSTPGDMIELTGEAGGVFVVVTCDHRCMPFDALAIARRKRKELEPWITLAGQEMLVDCIRTIERLLESGGCTDSVGLQLALDKLRPRSSGSAARRISGLIRASQESAFDDPDGLGRAAKCSLAEVCQAVWSLSRRFDEHFEKTSSPAARLHGLAATKALFDVLEAVEWSGRRRTTQEPCCPKCEALLGEQHADYCHLNRALSYHH